MFYQQYDNGDADEYTVVAPPMGAEVPSLPKDAKSITIDGQQYYELNGIYYQPITNDNGSIAYRIVGKDGELNTDQNADQQEDQYQNNASPDNNQSN